MLEATLVIVIYNTRIHGKYLVLPEASRKAFPIYPDPQATACRARTLIPRLTLASGATAHGSVTAQASLTPN